MAEAPIMPLATDAYLADTVHLSTIEHGAYLLLLMTMWRAGGRLPNNQKKLARFTRMSPGQFARIWPNLEAFFFIDGDQIGQGKCDDFLEAVRRKSKSASDSARAKWRKNKKTGYANASDPQCEQDAIQDPANQDPKDAALRARGAFLDEVRKAASAPETPDWRSDLDLGMAVDRWLALGIDRSELLAAIRNRSPASPPRTPRYFDPIMAELAGRKRAPPLAPVVPMSINGGTHHAQRPAFETAYDRRKRDREEAEAAERDEAQRLARFYGAGAGNA